MWRAAVASCPLARNWSFTFSLPFDAYHSIFRPKVISSKDLPPKTANHDIKMYDAVLEKDKSPRESAMVDAEMDKFLPMLKDYLKRASSPSTGGRVVNDPQCTTWIQR